LKRTLVLALVASVALVSMPASAQLSLVKPISIGIAGGGSLPMSDFADANKTGYNGTLVVALKLPVIPVGLRLDGAYNRFAYKGVDGNLQMASATGNLTYNLPSIGISPYLIGGAGMYSWVQSVDGLPSTDRENDFGWNAGAGIKLPLVMFSTFVEARYNRVSVGDGHVDFVPVTFGIMF